MNILFPGTGRHPTAIPSGRSICSLASTAATVLALSVGVSKGRAQFSFAQTFNQVNLVVPDGSGVGVSDTRQINSGLVGTLSEVRISLEISGGFTGDLYVAMLHDGATSVLLNRVGRRAGDDWGYSDSGLNVTFADGAASGDVHSYRLTLSGNHGTPLGGPLGGIWQPDARTADPASVLDTSLRSSYLSVFKGSVPDGAWTIYLADLASVGECTLRSWSIEVVVPEPGRLPVLSAFGLLGFALVRRVR